MEPSQLLVGMQNGALPVVESKILLLRFYPRELKTCSHKHLYTNVPFVTSAKIQVD